MNSVKIILTFFGILHQFLFTNEFSLLPKHFKVERAGSCKPDLKHGGKIEKFDISQPSKDHFNVDADIRFFDDITEPIRFHIKYVKCPFENEGSTCDAYETLQVDNVCDRLMEKNALWTPLLRIIKPKLTCPIKKGVYTIRNGTLDLTMISRLPIDGYRYLTTLSLYEVFKNHTQPLQLSCLDSDVLVTLRETGRGRPRTRTKG